MWAENLARQNHNRRNQEILDSKGITRRAENRDKSLDFDVEDFKSIGSSDTEDLGEDGEEFEEFEQFEESG